MTHSGPVIGPIPPFAVTVRGFETWARVSAESKPGTAVGFTLTGIVHPFPDIVPGHDHGEPPHPLIGRAIAIHVRSAGGRRAKTAQGPELGWLQFCPFAPDIAATVDISCCARRYAVLRNTAIQGLGGKNRRLTATLLPLIDPAATSADPAAAGTAIRRPVGRIGLAVSHDLGGDSGAAPACRNEAGESFPAGPAPGADVLSEA